MIGVIHVFPPDLRSQQSEVSAKTPRPSFKLEHQLLILTSLLEAHSARMQEHFWVTCDIVLKCTL